MLLQAPPGAPPAGTYNTITTTTDCNGKQTVKYENIPANGPGITRNNNNNCNSGGGTITNNNGPTDNSFASTMGTSNNNNNNNGGGTITNNNGCAAFGSTRTLRPIAKSAVSSRVSCLLQCYECRQLHASVHEQATGQCGGLVAVDAALYHHFERISLCMQ